MNIRSKIAGRLWKALEIHKHDHILRYKEIEIGNSCHISSKPFRVLYEEFAPGKYGVWYEECDV